MRTPWSDPTLNSTLQHAPHGACLRPRCGAAQRGFTWNTPCPSGCCTQTLTRRPSAARPSTSSRTSSSSVPTRYTSNSVFSSGMVHLRGKEGVGGRCVGWVWVGVEVEVEVEAGAVTVSETLNRNRGWRDMGT